jgi:predicted amidohydrolase
MRAIALQYAPHWHDKAASHRLIESMIAEADPPPGSLVALPEMSDTGWSLDADAVVTGDTTGWASEVAIRFGIHLAVGFARKVNRPPGAANAVVIAHPDGTLGPVYEKVHPFGFTEEPRHFAAGEHIVIDRAGEFLVAPSICYDLRFPELHRVATAQGAELLVIVANWPRERAMHWRSLVIARAIENQACVVAVNRTGEDPNFSFGGGSLIVSPTGDVLAEGGDAPQAVSAELDPVALRDWRVRFPALTDRRLELRHDFPVVAAGSRTDADKRDSDS